MDLHRNENAQTGLNMLDLSVSDSGYAVLDTSWHNENVCSPYSRLYLVESGEGCLETQGETVVMKPGFAYLIPPGYTFGYACKERLTKLFFHISLPKPNGYDLFRGFGRIGIIPLEAGILELMLTAYRRGTVSDLVSLKQHLYGITGEFLEAYGFAREPMEVYSHHVQETIDYIQTNLSARLDVETLAKRLFVSKSFLSDRFRQEMGVPLGKYIDDQLMLTAQWQLLRTEKSIGQISNALGFCDQFYFSRRFRQLCGVTPLQYRKKIRAADHWR